MKILYVSGMYPTPAYPQKGIFCHEQVKALIKKGIDVTVVVPVTFYDREVKVKEWEYEGVKINYVKFFKLPGTRGFHKIGKYFYNRLKKRFDLKGFDVYHADAPLPAGDAVMRASKKYKVPFVVHGHGLDVFFNESYEGAKNCKKIERVCEECYKKANAVIGVSQKVLDKVEKRVNLQNRGFVAYNGVDTDKFTPIEKPLSETLDICSIGNLIPLKGHRYLLEAIKIAGDKGIKIKCVIAGRGYLEEELKKQSKELGISDLVEFKGYVPYVEVTKLLQNSDAFVLPSYYEALGCVYLEAMACGIPALGCYENGIDEVITHEEDGFLTENKNVEQIVDSLITISNKEKCKTMGKKARKTVEEKYQWIHSAESLLKIYEHVLSKVK